MQKHTAVSRKTANRETTKRTAGLTKAGGKRRVSGSCNAGHACGKSCEGPHVKPSGQAGNIYYRCAKDKAAVLAATG